MTTIRGRGEVFTGPSDGGEWESLGWTDTDGLTVEPAPTVTVELADLWAVLLGTRTLTGGVPDTNGMVRFDQPNGAVWISRDALNLNEEAR